MPQPHGTFLRSQAKDKTVHAAKQDKRSVADAQEKARRTFFKELDRHSARDIDRWLKHFGKLKDSLKTKQKDAASDGDDTLRLEVKVVKHVKELLNTANELKELSAIVGRDVRPVLRATPPAASGGWDLATIIVLVELLRVLLQLRKSK